MLHKLAGGCERPASSNKIVHNYALAASGNGVVLTKLVSYLEQGISPQTL